jgi:hypothetical protein
MRLPLLVASFLALVLAATAGWAGTRAGGTLSIENGRGTVTVRGGGTAVGRLDRGELVITDLTPLDQWSPRVNGVPRGRVVSLRGKDVNFYVPGGRFRIVARGEGIAISVRGQGVATLKARPDGAADPGTFAVGDGAPVALPVAAAKVVFGGGTEAPAKDPT